MREVVGPALPEGPDPLAELFCVVPIDMIAPAPLERAVSTAGGAALTGWNNSC